MTSSCVAMISQHQYDAVSEVRVSALAVRAAQVFPHNSIVLPFLAPLMSSSASQLSFRPASRLRPLLCDALRACCAVAKAANTASSSALPVSAAASSSP